MCDVLSEAVAVAGPCDAAADEEENEVLTANGGVEAASATTVFYQKVSPREHVLLRPDMYIGSVKTDTQTTWVFDPEQGRMVQRSIQFAPGFLKIVDEILMNAVDYSVRTRMPSMASGVDAVVKRIAVTLDDPSAPGAITVENDGDGIPVQVHPTEGIYIPELIFGHLMTSTNYNDQEMRTVGGKNGIGAKACNIYSKWFTVETVDAKSGLRYYQRFSENMGTMDAPVVTPLGAGRKKRGGLSGASTTGKKRNAASAAASSSSSSSSGLTRISFMPDYERFGMMGGLDKDTQALLVKRVHDITAVTEPDVAVFLNGKKLETKSFERYCDLYLGERGDRPRVYHKLADGWELVVSLSDSQQFQHVSFVNGVATLHGGKHVDHIAGLICRKLAEMIESRKKGVVARPKFIRDNLFLFVRATVPNPAFNSQSKELLTTPVGEFGIKLDLPDKLMEKVYKLGDLVDRVSSISSTTVDRGLKKTDGTKRSTIYGIPKLEDAEWAGTGKSPLCTLILTEGDSAKNMAISGMAVVGRQRYGVFPLRGKVLNVCDASAQKISDNVEIGHLKKILGLQAGRKYTSASELRYGRLMLLADADVDGSHIKGLLMNLFVSQWSSLIELPGFMCTMLTPIVKVRRIGGGQGGVAQEAAGDEEGLLAPPQTADDDLGGGRRKKRRKGKKGAEVVDGEAAAATAAAGGVKRRQQLSFYNLTDFAAWKQRVGMDEFKSAWKCKYYKGLGTSTNEEAQEYFRDMHLIEYVWTNESKDALDLAFNTKRADDRKDWLRKYDPSVSLDFGSLLPPASSSSAAAASDAHGEVMHVPFEEFINKEIIHFSYYDVQRSIPSVVDGFKVSQRKVLFGCFKRNLREEIRVAQLTGYVSEHSAYHHGDASLNGTIINMAQNFVGSNNINLLEPVGQFGSRCAGGADCSSPRYIHTHLASVTRLIFCPEDDDILDYLEDDGFAVEPRWYLPVIPMVLVNGATGIGTGYSTSVPCYNPRHIISAIKRRLSGAAADSANAADSASEVVDHLVPWYRGFSGEIVQGRKSGTRGVAEQLPAPNSNKIRIRELPIGIWTDNFKVLLEAFVENNPVVKGYSNGTKDTNKVEFVVTFQSAEAAAAYLAPDESCMTRLDKELKLYNNRGVATTNMHLFDPQGRIKKYASAEEIIDDFVGVRLEGYEKRKSVVIEKLSAEAILLEHKIRFLDLVIQGRLALHTITSDEELDAAMQEAGLAAFDGSYKYLTSMPMSSMTQKRKSALEKTYENTKAAIAKLEGTSPLELWTEDLERLDHFLEQKGEY